MNERRAIRHLLPWGSLVLLAFTGCGGADGVASAPPQLEGSVQSLRASVGPEGEVFVGLDFLATQRTPDGIPRPHPCSEGELSVLVRAGFNGEPLSEVERLRVDCVQEATADMALVVDNSGSLGDVEQLVKEGATGLADRVLWDGGRVSLTRVSTDATARLPLSDDIADVVDALEGLQSRRGWTALWDGIRLGNATLGGDTRDDMQHPDSLAAFCQEAHKVGIVAFTDGRDNNSAGQQLATEFDDGIDTRYEDLFNLGIGSLTTPIYTIGLGDDVDHARLQELARHTGGRHVRVEHAADLPEVFATVGEYTHATHMACASLPRVRGCGELTLELDFEYDATLDAALVETHTYQITVPCPSEPTRGRSATMLLTMSSPGIPRDIAKAMAVDAVRWTSPVEEPRVLVVLDDIGHYEFGGDADYIAELLREEGFDVTRVRESANTMRPEWVADYDVVWFSNPGMPIDDQFTMETLLQHREQGGGFVLQGDDMSWALGRRFSMTPYTQLVHRNNGTRYCGRHIDGNRRDVYTIDVGDGHPLVATSAGSSFVYGDDMDATTPAGRGEQVLAWARAAWDDSCERLPVLVGFDPAELGQD